MVYNCAEEAQVVMVFNHLKPIFFRMEVVEVSVMLNCRNRTGCGSKTKGKENEEKHHTEAQGNNRDCQIEVLANGPNGAGIGTEKS